MLQTSIYFAFAILGVAYLLSLSYRQDVVNTFVAVSAVSAVLLVGPIINPTSLSALRRPNRRTWAWRPFRIAEATNYDSVGPQAPNILVIRGVDDEAALVLASGSIATAINRFVLGALSKGLHVVLSLLFAFALPFRVWRGDLSNIDRWALFGFAVLWVGICLCLLAPGLFKSPFGTEFLLGASRCEIATESTPDSTRARIVTLHTPYQVSVNTDWVETLLEWYHRLRSTSTSTTSSPRHSLYNNPDCVPEIVKWLNAHFDSCPNDA